MIILVDDDDDDDDDNILPFFLPSLRLLYEAKVHNNKNASTGEWMIILEVDGNNEDRTNILHLGIYDLKKYTTSMNRHPTPTDSVGNR